MKYNAKAHDSEIETFNTIEQTQLGFAKHN